MKNLFKIALSLTIAATVAISSAALVFGAEWPEKDTNGIYAEFKGTDFNEAIEGSKNETTGQLDLLGNGGRNLWGLYLDNAPNDTVLKMAFYLTVEEDQDFRSADIKFRPINEVYANYNMAELFEDNTGKVIIVVPFKVFERPEGLLWIDGAEGLDATVDKVVVAKADYNFAKGQGEYTLIAEEVPNAGQNQSRGTPADDEWVRSSADGADNPTGDEPADDEPADDNKDDNKDTPVKTGDVSAIVAVLTAGAAVFGGLKLRRK